MDLYRHRGCFGNHIFKNVINLKTVNQLIDILNRGNEGLRRRSRTGFEPQFPWNQRPPSCQMQMLEWISLLGLGLSLTHHNSRSASRRCCSRNFASSRMKASRMSLSRIRRSISVTAALEGRSHLRQNRQQIGINTKATNAPMAIHSLRLGTNRPRASRSQASRSSACPVHVAKVRAM